MDKILQLSGGFLYFFAKVVMSFGTEKKKKSQTLDPKKRIIKLVGLSATLCFRQGMYELGWLQLASIPFAIKSIAREIQE